MKFSPLNAAGVLSRAASRNVANKTTRAISSVKSPLSQSDDQKLIIWSNLSDRIYRDYLARNPYAARYEAMVKGIGGRVVNDHFAYRSFANLNTGGVPAGIFGIARVIAALGYKPAGNYNFPDRNLQATHFTHNIDPEQPKIFISEFDCGKLPGVLKKALEKDLRESKDPLSLGAQEMLQAIKDGGVILSDTDRILLVNELVKYLTTRPWPNLPSEALLAELNEHSQYAAWVYLFGNGLNHATISVNHQNLPGVKTIEETIAFMRVNGIPINPEGIVGPSFLRQSSTKSVLYGVKVRGFNGEEKIIKWPGSYLEIAERGYIIDPATGKKELFYDFIEDNTRPLFAVTNPKLYEALNCMKK